MDTLNHADQMRLANLINDNSDDAEIQKKMDQVVELTNSTRDQATVALHDCHYDVEKAVDMILEGDPYFVENQWKSAGKKKNKNVSQAKAGNQAGSGYHSGSNKHTGSNRNHHTSVSASGGHPNAGGGSSNANHPGGSGSGRDSHHQLAKGTNQIIAAAQTASTNQPINTSTSSSNKQDASDSLKNIVGAASSNIINSSDSANSSSAPVVTNKPSTQQQQQPQSQQSQSQQQQPQQVTQQQQQQQHQQQTRQKGSMQLGGRQQHQRSTKIPESAVEMPNNEFHVSSLNVQFGELDLKDATVSAPDSKGAFQDVLESSRLGRQAGQTNSHSAMPSQDNKGGRQLSQQQQQQQHSGRGGPRRPYNNTGDDRRSYYNNRGGRPTTSGSRPYNQRTGQVSNNNTNNNQRGVRTILNRGLQPSSGSSGSAQQSGGFPNSIDTWTNSTAEAATKQPSNQDQAVSGVGGTLRVGQWSDVAGNEDWSEEEHWDAKVMETKVFTPSSKAVDVPSSGSKSQSILTDTSVPSQMNLKSKMSEAGNSQTTTLNTVTQPVPTQSSQKPLSHMNDIFDPSVAKAVLEQQNLAAMKTKTSMGISQYGKDASDAKVLDSQNLTSIKPKTNMSINHYNKEASESLKSLVGISSTSSSSSTGGAKGGVPSVPPGALPSMIQPHQYIMGNAYQPAAIFPYAYQTPDVTHYPVAAPTAGRDQAFQSVYSPNDGNKFNRGADGDAPSITTTQTAPVASQTHNQAFVANTLHAGYQLTYMPGAFNMMPQNLYSAAPMFPHIPQPTNTGSANTVYQKNSPASYQHHTGYSGYDQLNPLIQDYVKQQQQNYIPTSKALGVSSDIDVAAGGNSYNMYGSVNKGQSQAGKQTNYNDAKAYQQQMSNNGPQQQFGFTHNAQQPSSMTNYPLLQPHNLDNSDLNSQGSVQSQLQHSSGQRGGSQVNQSKYYPSWS